MAVPAEIVDHLLGPEAWTLRHDLNSIRAVPGLRAGREDNVDRGRVRSSTD